MTAATDRRHAVQWIRQHGSIDDKLECIERFFDEVYCPTFNVVLNELGEIQFSCVGEDGQEYTIRIDGHRCYCGPLTSKARVAELIGMPVAFIEGIQKGVEITKRAKSQAFDLLAVQQRKCSHKLQALSAWENTLREKGRRIRESTRTRLEAITPCKYPAVPTNQFPVPKNKNESNLPNKPGIYFLFRGNNVAYVGQSSNLRNRVTEGHHVLEIGDLVSCLTCDYSMLDFAESYYIGICQPKLNFGKNAKWKGRA